jgi:hypothetical protein
MPWLTSSRGRGRTVALPIASRLAGAAQVHATTAVDAAVSGAVRTGPTVASARAHAHQLQEPSWMTRTVQSAVPSVAGGLDQASGVGLVVDEADVEIVLTAVRR